MQQSNNIESSVRLSARALRAGAVALLLAFFFSMAGVLRAEPGFSATLNRDTINMGEYAILTLSFTDLNPPQQPNFKPPSGFTVGYMGSGQQINIVNNTTTSVITHNYQLSPAQPGDFTIPSITVVIGGKQYASQPLKIKVLKAGEKPPQEAGTSQYAFAKMIVPKRQVYAGETFPVDIQLFIRSGQPSYPHLESEGFTFGKMIVVPNSHARVQMSNGIFDRLIVQTTATAVKSGTLNLGPAQCPMTIRLARDPFDLFAGYENKQIVVQTEQIPIQALALPQENVPSTFTGAVGSYNLTASAGPTNVTVGDPITVKIAISGRGPIDTLNLPSFDTWREFKTYPPTTQVNLGDQLGLQGTKSFELVVVPENAEIKALPPVVFSFFDPAQKKYRTVSSPVFPLTVHPPSTVQAQPTIVANTTKPQEPAQKHDIVHIKTYPGTLGAVEPPLLQRGWFLGLQSLPLLAWVTAFLWRRRNEMLANNPRLRRRREVERLIEKGLTELHVLAEGNRAEDFFAGMFRLMQEQLGERLDLPASAITESVIDERLKPAGAEAGLLADLHELFQTCNSARYAPNRPAHELKALLAKVEATLRALRSLTLEEA